MGCRKIRGVKLHTKEGFIKFNHVFQIAGYVLSLHGCDKRCTIVFALNLYSTGKWIRMTRFHSPITEKARIP